ncbi:YafY family protein [soil metagenome]
MRRADRLLQLLQILRRHRRPVTGETIAGELEVSLRTVYRDIAALIGQRVPVRGEAGIGYVLDDGFDLPPLMFSVDELEAVMLGLRWVGRSSDKTLARAARDSIAKIGTVLPQGLKPYLYDSSLIIPPGFTDIEPAVDESELRSAIREERKIDIRYVDLADAETRRTIWPIALAYYDRKRLLVGWCEMRDAFRSFRTERIAEAYVLAERYPKRRKVLLSLWQVELQDEYKVDHIDVLE